MGSFHSGPWSPCLAQRPHSFCAGLHPSSFLLLVASLLLGAMASNLQCLWKRNKSEANCREQAALPVAGFCVRHATRSLWDLQLTLQSLEPNADSCALCYVRSFLLLVRPGAPSSFLLLLVRHLLLLAWHLFLVASCSWYGQEPLVATLLLGRIRKSEAEVVKSVSGPMIIAPNRYLHYFEGFYPDVLDVSTSTGFSSTLNEVSWILNGFWKEVPLRFEMCVLIQAYYARPFLCATRVAKMHGRDQLNQPQNKCGFTVC